MKYTSFILQALFVFVFVLSSCKKDDQSDTDPEGNSNQTEACEGEYIYTVAEEMPQIIGGYESIQVEYPEELYGTGVEGTVYITTVITKDGEPTDIKVLRGIHELCDQEAINEVEKTEWIPGKQRGEPVCVQMNFPIPFEEPN